MRVTLDLTKLRARGEITDAEYEKLSRLGSTGAATMAFNILVGFGAIAVGAGLIALVPDALTGVVVGAIFLGGGLAIYGARLKAWEVLGHICVLIGALMLAGGIVILTDASVAAFLAVAAGFAVVGVIADSTLLLVLAVGALSSALGARTDYFDAMYFLGMKEPGWSVLLFSALALGAYQVTLRTPARFDRLGIAVARTSILIVNLGFWIGSLWGDDPAGTSIEISKWVFVVGWAVALIAAGAWAAQANRPWLVTVATVFGAIHFYTQWFEWLGPQPAAIVLGGAVALTAAGGLWRFNRRLWDSSAMLPRPS